MKRLISVRHLAAYLVVSLFLLTAPPAQADHVIAAAIDPEFGFLFSLTNTGEVYQTGNLGTTWLLIGTVPDAFGFSGFNFDGAELWLLSLQGTSVFRSLATIGGIGSITNPVHPTA